MVGATRPRKKFDDIFIHFDTIAAVINRYGAVAKTPLTTSSGLKLSGFCCSKKG